MYIRYVRAAASSPADRRRRPQTGLRHRRRHAQSDRARQARRRVQPAPFGVSDGDAGERLVDVHGRLPGQARPVGKHGVLSAGGPDEIPRHLGSQQPAEGRRRRGPPADRYHARRIPSGGRPEDARRQLRVYRFGLLEQSHGVGRGDPPLSIHIAAGARRRDVGDRSAAGRRRAGGYARSIRRR